MTDIPSSTSPQNSYDPRREFAQTNTARSATVIAPIVWGILNILYGAFGTCGFGAWIVIFASAGGRVATDENTLAANDALWAFNLARLGIGFTISLAAIMAGFGLLLRRRWGRLLSIGYAIISILMFIAIVGVDYIVFWRAIWGQGGGLPAGMKASTTTIRLLLGYLLQLYPVVLLVFMLRMKSLRST